jgi:hypothetical protein
MTVSNELLRTEKDMVITLRKVRRQLPDPLKMGGGIAKFAQVLGIIDNTFRPTLVKKT